MTPLDAVPLWAAIPAALFLVVGSTLALIGSFGLFHLKTFYERLHAPTLGTSWAAAGVVLSSAIVVTVLQSRPVVHELLIALFITITTPVTLMLLGRAVLYRDETERAEDETLQDDPFPAEPHPDDEDA